MKALIKDKLLLLIVAIVCAGLAHISFHYLDQYTFDVIAFLIVIIYGSKLVKRFKKSR